MCKICDILIEIGRTEYCYYCQTYNIKKEIINAVAPDTQNANQNVDELVFDYELNYFLICVL